MCDAGLVRQQLGHLRADVSGRTSADGCRLPGAEAEPLAGFSDANGYDSTLARRHSSMGDESKTHIHPFRNVIPVRLVN